jgi:hypothetical protein
MASASPPGSENEPELGTDPELPQRGSTELTLGEVLLFAPIGLAIQVGTKLPSLIAEGQAEYRKKAMVARFIGKAVVDQQKRKRRLASTKSAVAAAKANPEPTTVTMFESAGAAEAVVDTSQAPEDVAEQADGARAQTGVSDGAASLPIAGYDTLAARSLLSLFDSLSVADLEAVRRYESTHRQRATVLNRLEQLLTPGS